CPSALPAGHGAFLHRVHADAVPPLAEALRALLPTAVVSAQAFSVTPYSQAPAHPHVLSFRADSGPSGTITCSPSLLAHLLDHLLGSDGIPATLAEEMSALTQAFLCQTLAELLPAYATAWADHLPPASFRATPAVTIAPDTPAFLAEYAVTHGSGRGTVTVLLPLPTWAPLLAARAPAAPAPRRDLAPTSPLLQAIGTCLLPVRAILGRTHVSVEELLDLRPGDIICLDQPGDAPVAIHIGARPRLQGRARVVEGQYHITITPSMTEGEAHGSE
ncbi:MAG TPA: FliM/FliN family flagellar motor C-terminal domain-containing protein, partial [Armatimonadota bacterium]|nr:FliM/FliN family flagellar motor C-terminal domain-containing protein [Armatimonadota bacterium]